MNIYSYISNCYYFIKISENIGKQRNGKEIIAVGEILNLSSDIL